MVLINPMKYEILLNFPSRRNITAGFINFIGDYHLREQHAGVDGQSDVTRPACSQFFQNGDCIFTVGKGIFNFQH